MAIKKIITDTGWMLKKMVNEMPRVLQKVVSFPVYGVRKAAKEAIKKKSLMKQINKRDNRPGASLGANPPPGP